MWENEIMRLNEEPRTTNCEPRNCKRTMRYTCPHAPMASLTRGAPPRRQIARRLRASTFDVAQHDPEPVEGSLGPQAFSHRPCFRDCRLRRPLGAVDATPPARGNRGRRAQV